MSKIIVSEGKTTSEAIEKGLKELNLHRDQVEIRVLEQEKRSFFDILAPRVVKVELTVKEKPQKEEKILTEEDLEETKNNLEKFIKEFLKNLGEEYKYDINIEKNEINVKIDGGNSGTLIGYRGETLNALQHILSLIANKHTSAKVRVLLNVDGYKEKREKTLEELALKVSKTVIRTNKSITLEPMNAYERKIIHSKLQDMTDIRTHSIGEEPHRRIVIEKVNK
jgi:single-stranded nucleic acid binding R3H domain protein